jgi:phosphatidylserine/phosphatidylglycerophosphate/cardiolipin synthase-like enzyme
MKLIIDKEINNVLQGLFLGAEKSLDIIAYSATRPRKTSHKMFSDTWSALRQACLNGVKVRVILECWNESNPQSLENQKVKTALEGYGAEVRIAKKAYVCTQRHGLWIIRF